MAVNSKLFMSNIPFYIVKPLYVFCVFIFYKMGVSLILATVLPSIIAYILIAGLLYYWVSMYYKPLVCFLFCAVFCTSNMIFNVARLSTPDMLSGFFIFMAIFFLLETSNKLLSYTFLLLALFTRLDNIIFGGTVIILLFLKKSLQQSITLRQSLLALTGLVVSAFIVTLGLRQFGWNVFFIQDFTKNLSYESNMVYTKEVYLKTLPITLKYTLQNTELPFFLFLSGMLLFQKISKWTLDNWLALLFVSLVILRYVLYPFTHNRFYVGYYFIITMLLLRSIYKYAILQKAT